MQQKTSTMRLHLVLMSWLMQTKMRHTCNLTHYDTLFITNRSYQRAQCSPCTFLNATKPPSIKHREPIWCYVITHLGVSHGVTHNDCNHGNCCHCHGLGFGTLYVKMQPIFVCFFHGKLCNILVVEDVRAFQCFQCISFSMHAIKYMQFYHFPKQSPWLHIPYK